MAQKSANLKATVLVIAGGLGLACMMCGKADAVAPSTHTASVIATLQPSDEGEREYNVDDEMPEPKPRVVPPAVPESITPGPQSSPGSSIPERDVDDEEMAREDAEKAAREDAEKTARGAEKPAVKAQPMPVEMPEIQSSVKKRQPPPIHVHPPTAEEKEEDAEVRPETADGKAKTQTDSDKSWRRDDDFDSAGVMRDARRVMPQVTPATKAATAGKPKLIVHTDISGQFSYILPDSWGTFAIPMQHHDLLAYREEGITQATINFTEGDRHSGLDGVKEKAIKERKDASTKFTIVSDREITLPGDQKCVRVIATANIDEQPSRQVIYVVSPRKHYNLVVTMTVAKSTGDKYDRALLHIVNSISTK